MRIRRYFTGLALLLLLAGCDADPTEKLVEVAQDNDFGVETVFMEMRGSYMTERWWKVSLYFGYGGNGNWDTCLQDAARLNAEQGAETHRCVASR